MTPVTQGDRPLFLAIDAGGTAVKLALFDAQGGIEASALAEVATEYRPNGWVERDGLAFWAAIARAIRSLVDTGRAARLVAVGCTGFGNGLFLTDAEGGPTRPGIVSVDHRAEPLVQALVTAGEADRLAAICGARLWGGQTVMQLAALAMNEPQVIAHSRWALSCKDYLRMRLTGEAASDPTDVSGGGLMRADGGGYARDLLAALGHSELAQLLPPIRPSGGIAGKVSARASVETGLPAGLPVAGGMMDVAACALAAGAIGGDYLVMIAGTWAINALETSVPPVGEWPILNMVHRDGAARLVAEGSPCSAANLGWFLSQGLGGRVGIEEAMDLAAACPVKGPRCHFLPFVHGPAPRRGSFTALGSGDNLGSMIRAVCEGVAFQHRRHADEILPHAGPAPPAIIRLTGGAARSAVWAQIFADVCGMPVETVAAPEVGALGAAICAAVAGGIYPDFASASRAMCAIHGRFDPDPGLRRFYDERYQEFLRLDRGMLGLAQPNGGAGG